MEIPVWLLVVFSVSVLLNILGLVLVILACLVPPWVGHEGVTGGKL